MLCVSLMLHPLTHFPHIKRLIVMNGLGTRDWTLHSRAFFSGAPVILSRCFSLLCLQELMETLKGSSAAEERRMWVCVMWAHATQLRLWGTTGDAFFYLFFNDKLCKCLIRAIGAGEPDFPLLQRTFKRRVAAAWLPRCRSLQVNTAPLVTRGGDGSPQQRRDAPNRS